VADHVNTQLRDAVVAALTGLATTGSRVFRSRPDPQRNAALPCLHVYTPGEQVSPESLDVPDIQRRDVEVRVEGLAAATADLDDLLDVIRKEVEVALSAALTVDAKSVRLTYVGCDVEVRRDVQQPHGAAVMNFTTDLYTLASAPDALIQS
jgi:hypothetical protein